MIRYSDLVQYTKENHVNWNMDLFDVLKGFFEEYSSHNYSHLPLSTPPVKQELIMPNEFKEPANGEYTTQDILNLFST